MKNAAFDDLLEPSHALIDFLLVADYAEVIGGKSYIVGAGWDRFSPPSYPAPMRLGVSVGVRVPFTQSNVPQHLAISLRNSDGQDIVAIEADLETGRAPGSRGESTLVPLAANLQVQIEGPQLLELVAQVGESVKRVNIRAFDAPPVAGISGKT
ncbi:MAG: hypothetical protein ABI553_04075 [Chloroflexota bacterium]